MICLCSDWAGCVTTPEIIAEVHKMVLGDRRLKVREIAEAIGMSSEWAYHILSEELDMKKLSARRMPQLLMQDQKRIGMEMSEECLTHFRETNNIFCTGL